MKFTPSKTPILVVFLIVLFSKCNIPSLWSQDDPKRWEETIQKFELEDQKNPVAPGSILFVGSSSIVFWKSLADDFPNHRVLNRGFGGSQFVDLLYYTDRIVLPYKPSKIFVYEGDNDIAAGKKMKKILKQAKKLRKIIRKNLGEDIPVVFISPKPSVARWSFKAEYEALNAALKAYTEQTPNTLYADVWSPSLDENGEVLKHIFIEDQLHMNAEGYKIWKKVISDFMD